MYLATEYLVRSGIAKAMLNIPFSLFLTELATGEKKVVTVAHGYRLPDRYVVKHWFVGRCTNQQVLPAIREYVVSCLDDPCIVLNGHRMLRYREHPVPVHLNSSIHPMSLEVYNRYADTFFDPAHHQVRRCDWLWDCFASVHCPHLKKLVGALYYYRSEQDAARDQRDIVQKHYPDRWSAWGKWRQYMLDFPGLPGELAYAGDYDEEA